MALAVPQSHGKGMGFSPLDDLLVGFHRLELFPRDDGLFGDHLRYYLTTPQLAAVRRSPALLPQKLHEFKDLLEPFQQVLRMERARDCARRSPPAPQDNRPISLTLPVRPCQSERALVLQIPVEEAS